MVTTTRPPVSTVTTKPVGSTDTNELTGEKTHFNSMNILDLFLSSHYQWALNKPLVFANEFIISFAACSIMQKHYTNQSRLEQNNCTIRTYNIKYEFAALF